MVKILGSNGCSEVTKDLDHNSFTGRPVAFGGFGDIYPGTMRNGLKVAVKCARINVEEMVEIKILKVGEDWRV